MAERLIDKILTAHLVRGNPVAGEKVGIRIDQTLTQDATGTMAYLEFEALGCRRVQTELSVSYVDHNMSQFGPENHNDHRYLQSVAARCGLYFSRAGNGICHQVHLERFGRPGKTLLGSDSHTPTGGGMGMVAIGAGGLDVALAMAGQPFSLVYPRIIGVRLSGSLSPWVSAKDVILRVLSLLTTRGNVGCMVEYFGPGVENLSVPERATITNMGAELGVTTSVFPADERTRAFLAAQDRADAYVPLAADTDVTYGPIEKRLHAERDAATIERFRQYGSDVTVSGTDADGYVTVTFGHLEIDLSALEPLTAAPSSPDTIMTIRELAGTPVAQVLVGSCTNSSLRDLMIVASVLRGRTVHPGVSFGVAPGSKQVFTMVAEAGGLTDLIAAGARILESSCGFCIGLGQSPGSDAVSLRTINRNFQGRSGTKDDTVYLVSPEVAVAAALRGEFTDPRELPALLGVEYPDFTWPDRFRIDDNCVIPPLPPAEAEAVEIVRGPTIGKPPTPSPLPTDVEGEVIIKVGDKITTDHIMPAGSLLKYRSNIPEYARYVFNIFNESGSPTFAERTTRERDQGRQGFVVGGESYGQGSSREHAAICPAYLGIRVKIARSFERIHSTNLVNFGIVPLAFQDPADYEATSAGDRLAIADLPGQLRSGQVVRVRNLTRNTEFSTTHALNAEEVETLIAGGKLAPSQGEVAR